jgi:hypothetical protein
MIDGNRHLCRYYSVPLYDKLPANDNYTITSHAQQYLRFRSVEWEETLPEDLRSRWRNWVTLLPQLRDIRIPRWARTSSRGTCQVHVFCDASETARGAALYIRSAHGTETSVQIACSKNRLAPLKKVTFPRLELRAALVVTRLLNYFSSETGQDTTQGSCCRIQPWCCARFDMTPPVGKYLSPTLSLKYRPTIRPLSENIAQGRTIRLTAYHEGFPPRN